MTRYELFRELREMCSMKQTGEYMYNKMIQTGQLEHYDYGTGFLDVCLYYMHMQDKHICRIWFGTIDDGDMGSWINFDNKEEAIKKLEEAIELFKTIDVFPTLKELNVECNKIGIHIIHE